MRMNVNRMIIGLALLLCALPLTASAAGPQERADRGTYNRLLQEVKGIEADYSAALDRAMNEAREGDGQASLETQSRLIALRNERDRVMQRLWIVALRHGWKVPGISPSDDELADIPSEEEEVFKGAEFVIKARFADEARRIAGTVALPVISVSDEEGEVRDD